MGNLYGQMNLRGTMKKQKRILLFIMAIAYVCSALFQPIHSHAVYAASQEPEIIVGTNAEYSPFEYRDSNGALTGFDYELLEAIAKEQGIKLIWNDLPFDALMGSMEAGHIQVIAAATGKTEERARSVDFSEIYYSGSQSIISTENHDFIDLEDLSGKNVAVLEGSTSDLIASGDNADYGQVEGAVVTRFKTASSAVMELLNGGVDAVLIDTIMAQIYSAENASLVYHEVDGPPEDMVFCVEKGNTALLQL